jgi:hypothetical protein
VEGFRAMKRSVSAVLSLGTVSAAAGLAIGLLLFLGPACTTHGEGGRCDPLNIVNGQFADCDTNLTCVQAGDIQLPEGGTSQASICCPSNRSALLPGDICALSPTTPGSDASIPDGGFDTGTTDATPDQSSDAPSDANDGSTITDASDGGG